MKKLWWFIFLLVLVGGGFFVFETFFKKDNNKAVNLNQENIENENVKSEAVAGSCLFFEQKYCNGGKLIYNEKGKVDSVEYDFESSVKLFSPISSNYSALEFVGENSLKKNIIFIGNQELVEIGGKRIRYQIIFDGQFADSIKKEGQGNTISKDDVFGTTNNNAKVYISVLDVFLDKEENVIKEINSEETVKLLK